MPGTPKPDWLVGSDEVTRDPGGPRRATAPTVTPDLRVVRSPGDSRPTPESLDDDPAEAVEPSPEALAVEATGKGAWKAAGSSVPRLRQQPAAASRPEAQESFTGFAQDAMMSNASTIGGSGAHSAAELLAVDTIDDTSPLAQSSPFWVDWFDRLGPVSRPVMIGAGVVLVLGLMVYLLWPRDTPGVSLAQIQQHPEAYTGRSVLVKGKAGESFSVGGSYVYNLYQGRDSIVVYSRTSPRLRERVKVEGTVSIGYLDGAPRVALLESQSTP